MDVMGTEDTDGLAPTHKVTSLLIPDAPTRNTTAPTREVKHRIPDVKTVIAESVLQEDRELLEKTEAMNSFPQHVNRVEGGGGSLRSGKLAFEKTTEGYTRIRGGKVLPKRGAL